MRSTAGAEALRAYWQLQRRQGRLAAAGAVRRGKAPHRRRRTPGARPGRRRRGARGGLVALRTRLSPRRLETRRAKVARRRGEDRFWKPVMVLPAWLAPRRKQVEMRALAREIVKAASGGGA